MASVEDDQEAGTAPNPSSEARSQGEKSDSDQVGVFPG